MREIRENDLFRTAKEDGRGVIVGGVIAVGGDDSGRKGERAFDGRGVIVGGVIAVGAFGWESGRGQEARFKIGLSTDH